jgi:hypothetical protein
MNLIYSIHVYDPDVSPWSCHGSWKNMISLPKGCGIEHAEAEIDKIIASLRDLSLEIHKAHTEGREVGPKFMEGLQ